MGCHTWFSRPLSEKEIISLIPYAYKELENWRACISNEHDTYLYARWKSELDRGDVGTICSLGEGDNYIRFINNKPYLDLSEPINTGNIRFKIARYFYDEFRVDNYPRKVIHSHRELKKWMRKRYFELTEEQINRINEFFKLYPGGIITFG